MPRIVSTTFAPENVFRNSILPDNFQVQSTNPRSARRIFLLKGGVSSLVPLTSAGRWDNNRSRDIDTAFVVGHAKSQTQRLQPFGRLRSHPGGPAQVYGAARPVLGSVTGNLTSIIHLNTGDDPLGNAKQGDLSVQAERGPKCEKAGERVAGGFVVNCTGFCTACDGTPIFSRRIAGTFYPCRG